jgi:hypothetical protein
MLNRKMMIKKSIMLVFLVLFVGLACEIPGIAPGPGTPGIQPTEAPGEPTQPPVEPTAPPVEPTEPPVEPTTPPEAIPTTPPEGGIPPEGGGEDSSDSLVEVLFWLLLLVIVILGIALIISLITSRRKESKSEPIPPPSDQPVSYAESGEEPLQVVPEPQAAPQTALDSMTPYVAELYDRFVNMLQALGPVTILPTQTRVDFQRRIIFASLQFSAEDMRVQFLLPERVDDPRMVRIEVFSEDKIAHSLVIRSVDDFDVHFSTWLGDSYNIGG